MEDATGVRGMVGQRGVLLYSTGNSTQHSVMLYMGKESEKELMCVHACSHTTESLCCTAEIITTL